MENFITITSQGQISIPAKVRKELGFTSPGKLLFTVEDNRLILENTSDLLDLGGCLEDFAKTDTGIDQVIKGENKAIKASRNKVAVNEG